MGCTGEKEIIEDKMMLMKLERMEIQMEKEKELKKLSDIEGHTIKRQHVPDYIDPKFAKEKQIYDDDDFYEDEEIGDKKTDDTQKKKKEKNEKKDKKRKNSKKNTKDDGKKKKRKSK